MIIKRGNASHIILRNDLKKKNIEKHHNAEYKIKAPQTGTPNIFKKRFSDVKTTSCMLLSSKALT